MKHEFFDEWVRQKAGAHEAPVPTDAWEKIAGRKKKRRRFLIWWWIPLAAGIMLLGHGVYRYARPEQKEKSMAAIPGQNMPTAQTGDKKLAGDNRQVSGVDKNEEAIGEQESALLLKTKKALTTNKKENSNGNIVTNPATGQQSRKKRTISSPGSEYQTDDFSTAVQRQKKDAGEITQVKGASRKQDEASLSQPEKNEEQTKEIDQNKKEIITLKEWTIDSTYLQPENLSAAATSKRRQTYFAEIYVSPFMPLQQVTRNEVSRVQESPGMKNEFVSSRIQSRPQMGWSGGIHIGKKLNARWQILSGLQYATFSERLSIEGREVTTHYNIVQRWQDQPGGPVLINDTVESYQYGRRYIDALNRYQTWSIPLLAGYQLMDTRMFSLQMQGGAVLHIARRYRNNIAGDFNNEGAVKQERSAVAQGFDLQAGLRLLLRPRSGFRVFGEPSFRYNVLPAQTSEMLQRKRLHQVGVSVGVQYGF